MHFFPKSQSLHLNDYSWVLWESLSLSLAIPNIKMGHVSKPSLWVTCPETHHCFLHYIPNSQVNPKIYYIITHLKGIQWHQSLFTTSFLWTCPLNSQSSDTTHLSACRHAWGRMKGWNWEAIRDQIFPENRILLILHKHSWNAFLHMVTAH